MLKSPLLLLLLGTGIPAAIASPFNVLGARDNITTTESSTASSTAAESTATIASPDSSQNISSYHTSDITYISPQIPAPINATHANPSSNWTAAHEKARSYLSSWTLEEKVSLSTGVGWEQGRCVGNIGAVESQGFRGLCLQDSPLGVARTDYISAFPAGINVAATFDKDLIYARGYAMGQEFKGKGVNVALGPMTNLGRVVAAGRGWEGFGGDPYLSGWATEATIRGLQDAGVQACVKHYIGNEQDRNRTTSSSNIDDRTLREIYSHPFLRAVQADVAAVMCSYNLVNGSWACENPKTLNGVLKTDFGFQGYVMSDWQAQHTGVLSAESGLDMSMPGDIVMGSLSSFWGRNLTEAVNNGTVSEARIDDMAQRILAAYFLLGQDEDYPEVNYDSFRLTGSNNSHVDVRGDHHKLIRHIGASSAILLKNENNALPLTNPRSIALIGSDLAPPTNGPNGFTYRAGIDGHTAMGWGSGSVDFPYLVDPLSAISQRARDGGAIINSYLDDWNTTAASYWASGAEVAIVGVHSDSGEAFVVDGNEGDRNNLTLWTNGDELVKAVASANNNTIVIVNTPGALIIEEWIDHPNVTAVLWAGLPGQESGNALVDVLWGDYNPSARLPYTIAKDRADYSADIVYTNSEYPVQPQIDYTEGLNIDYRHFLSEGIEPRFAFGYGLSYTSFELSNLIVDEVEGAGDLAKRYVSDNPQVDESTEGEVVVGKFVVESLHKPRWTVSIDVTNTGDVNGCEIPQLYLVYPESAGEPPKVLRDFARINLDPGATKTVSWNLSQYDVSIWDVESQEWVVPEGEFGVEVGKYVADADAQTGSFTPQQ